MESLLNAHATLIESAVRAAQAAGDLPAFVLPPVEIKPPNRPEMGDYAYAGGLAFSKTIGMKPLDIAQAIAKHLESAPFLAAIEVAPPGFINFRLNPDWLRAQVAHITTAGDQLGVISLGAGKSAQVEFVSANPTGPLHIGRSRGAIVGDTMARLLEAAGYTVQREYYFNNAGAQMRNLGNSMKIRYLQALGLPAELPKEEGTFYQGEYLKEFAELLVSEKGHTLVDEDWEIFKEYAEQKMFLMIQQTLARIQIKHDNFFNENALYDDGSVDATLKALQARDLIYTGAVRETETDEIKAQNAKVAPAHWFRSTRFGDTEDRVVLRSDGSPTYTLPDIAYHMNKLARGYDLLVNVLGADHFTEHQVVKYGVRALGGDADKIHVIIMQFVRLIRAGKEVKMSTRRGDYETLDDLIEQTSSDAVRYMLLARSANSRLDFDLDLAVRQSTDNPVYYIQYAYVRCAGILREAEARGFTDADADMSLLDVESLSFVRRVLTLGDEVRYSVESFEPHRIAFYAHDLASAFHTLYDRLRVFGDGVDMDIAAARLRFYKAAHVAFNRVLMLMGMSAPDRM